MLLEVVCVVGIDLEKVLVLERRIRAADILNVCLGTFVGLCLLDLYLGFYSEKGMSSFVRSELATITVHEDVAYIVPS